MNSCATNKHCAFRQFSVPKPPLLLAPPANRLKKLKGALSDFYSIRINDQWRIIFYWQSNNAENVQITDYHE
ncbi:MAG: type II toxin-antitoxin system RelE/ParE family toxin [Saprospiraceae bacterium]|nr:type II toxin-antitoxin system RelE/ParE family toxin [Saprospiraceae bacterium]